jgi:hypothetical protein
MTTEERVEALYVAALGRKPTSEESSLMTRHVESGAAKKTQARLGDVMWVLLNSAEFRINH